MTLPTITRRTMLQSTAASVAAAGFVDALLDPSSAWAQSDRMLRARANRAILSTDPGYMIGGFEMVLQYCLPGAPGEVHRTARRPGTGSPANSSPCWISPMRRRSPSN